MDRDSSSLSRYDGYSFTNYLHDSTDPNSLGNNFVNNIYQDADGILWIGTEGGGVTRLDPRSVTFHNYMPFPQDSTSIGGDRIKAGFEDSAGNHWFGGTPFGGLSLLQPGAETFIRYNGNDPQARPFPDGAIYGFAEDASKRLWVLTDRHLLRYDTDTDTFISYDYPVKEEQRTISITRGSDGIFWLGGQRGLYRFDPQSETFTQYQFPGVINSLVTDETGLIWVGSDHGLAQFDSTKGKIIHQYHAGPNRADSLNGDAIRTLYIDRPGLLWIGTDRGINLYDPRQTRFTYYRNDAGAKQSISGGVVLAIDAVDKTHVWAAIGSTLDDIDLNAGKVTHYSSDSLDNSRINAVLQDHDGIVWIGTDNAQLFRLDPQTGTFAQRNFRQPIPGRRVPIVRLTAISEDEQGVLWIVVDQDGLYRMDAQRNTVQLFQPPPPNPG